MRKWCGERGHGVPKRLQAKTTANFPKPQQKGVPEKEAPKEMPQKDAQKDAPKENALMEGSEADLYELLKRKGLITPPQNQDPGARKSPQDSSGLLDMNQGESNDASRRPSKKQSPQRPPPADVQNAQKGRGVAGSGQSIATSNQPQNADSAPGLMLGKKGGGSAPPKGNGGSATKFQKVGPDGGARAAVSEDQKNSNSSGVGGAARDFDNLHIGSGGNGSGQSAKASSGKGAKHTEKAAQKAAEKAQKVARIPDTQEARKTPELFVAVKSVRKGDLQLKVQNSVLKTSGGNSQILEERGQSGNPSQTPSQLETPPDSESSELVMRTWEEMDLAG